MAYVLVKKFSEQGCLAVKLKNGEEVAGIRRYLNARLNGTDKQVITISRPEAWGEYALYTVLQSVGDFIDKAEAL